MGRFLDPSVLAQLEGLRLIPRFADKTSPLGARVSPQSRGQSMEFTDYRSYTPGEDPRRIDWRVWARQDRYFLKSYEGETSSSLWIALDASRSMTFAGPDSVASKWPFACRTALGLCYVALANGDAAGLVLFSQGIVSLLSARAGWENLFKADYLLDSFNGFGTRTDYASSFEAIASRMARRCVVVVLSDVLGAAPGKFTAALEALAGRRHEVIVLRVVEPFEVRPDGGGRVWRLLPIEEEEEIQALEFDFRDAASAYQFRWDAEESELSRRLSARSIDFQTFLSVKDPGRCLAQYLSYRQGR